MREAGAHERHPYGLGAGERVGAIALWDANWAFPRLHLWATDGGGVRL